MNKKFEENDETIILENLIMKKFKNVLIELGFVIPPNQKIMIVVEQIGDSRMHLSEIKENSLIAINVQEDMDVFISEYAEVSHKIVC